MKNLIKTLLLIIIFWNTENYFDPFNNPGTNDDDFTPSGKYYWTWKKFEKKRDDLAKVILIAADECGQAPALIGLAEVENRFVLNQLVNETPLARLNYRIIHKDSPDPRGIDVALLYRPEVFKVLKVRFLPDSTVLSSFDRNGTGCALRYNTRWILYAKGLVNQVDTLHVFVNHWPSKLGGEQKTLESRMLVSNILRSFTDSIFYSTPAADIVLMGDFNDGPGSAPLKNLSRFKNCATYVAGLQGDRGTHKYNGKWEVLDQFLISQHLVYNADNNRNKLAGSTIDSLGAGKQWLYCTDSCMTIFHSGFLLEKDKIFLGDKMRKTLNGPQYLGGTSDHLPILLKIMSPQF